MKKNKNYYNNKYNQLVGDAYHKLARRTYKRFMFKLVKMANLDICFRCGQKIENSDDFSIEHKIQWQSQPTDELKEKFFYNWSNIAFSHKRCNFSYANWRKPNIGFHGIERIGDLYYPYASNNGIKSRMGSFKDPVLAAEEFDTFVIKYCEGKGRINFRDKLDFYKERIKNGWKCQRYEDKIKSVNNLT